MTDKEINLAVALSADWEPCPEPGAVTTARWRTPGGGYSEHIPDFANSLTAIRSVLMRWKDNREQQGYFECELVAVLKRDLKRVVTDFDIAMATARQLCEAYLRSIDKW